MKPSYPDNMHIGKSPFPTSHGNSRPGAKMTGIGSKPGGEGKLQSANSAMRKKSPMQGPGKA